MKQPQAEGLILCVCHFCVESQVGLNTTDKTKPNFMQFSSLCELHRQHIKSWDREYQVWSPYRKTKPNFMLSSL